MRYRQHHHRRRNWAERFIELPDQPSHIPYGYCWCGCGGKAPLAAQSWPRLGVLKDEPMRYIKWHHNILEGPEYLEEFKSTVSEITTPCWIWQHAKGPLGYGCRAGKGESRIAHKMMYERRHGPVPKGLELDHLCRVHPCVNPDHLEPVTHRVNMERSANTKLNHEKADEIRIRFSMGESKESLGLAFGVAPDTIRHVCEFKTWLRESTDTK